MEWECIPASIAASGDEAFIGRLPPRQRARCENRRKCRAWRRSRSLAGVPWRLERRFELGEQRVLLGEHVVEVGDRHGFGAVIAQERGEGVDLSRRAVQRQHPRRGRAAERGLDRETLTRGGEKLAVASGKARAHLAERAGALLRGAA